LSADKAQIKHKQTWQEIGIQNNKNKIETNRRTLETRQDDSTRTLNNRINNLLEQERHEQKTIETLKNGLLNNAALLNDTSTNQESTNRIVEDTPITTCVIIMLIIWNAILTIICVYFWYSFLKQQSPNQNATSMEAPVCINPIYATSVDMTDYSSTQENRSRQLPTNRWPDSKKVIANPIYQSSVDQCDDGLYSEI
jgi:hypothetical protein